MNGDYLKQLSETKAALDAALTNLRLTNAEVKQAQRNADAWRESWDKISKQHSLSTERLETFAQSYLHRTKELAPNIDEEKFLSTFKASATCKNYATAVRNDANTLDNLKGKSEELKGEYKAALSRQKQAQKALSQAQAAYEQEITRLQGE